MPGLTLLLAAAAFARDVVIFDGDIAPAVAFVQRGLGSTSEVVMVRPPEIPGADRPTVLGSAQAFCRDDTTGNAAVRDLVSRAEGHLAYQRTAEALAVLDNAARTLECLPEPIEASLAGRLFFLRGVVALREGDLPGAEATFRLAALFQPGLGWDGRFPPDPTGTFTRAVTPVPATVSVPIGLGPGSSMWVDGRAPSPGTTLTLSPGVHHVQVLDNGRAHTARLTVAADLPLAVVTPGWLAAVDLAGLDPAGRRTLGEVARRAYPGDTLHAVSGGALYRLDDPWRALPMEARTARLCAEPRRCVGTALLGGGLGALVSGGVVLGVAQARVGGLAASPDGETEAAYQERVGAQAEAARWLPVGGVLAAVGAVVTGAGVVLELPRGTEVAWTGTGLRVGGAF